MAAHFYKRMNFVPNLQDHPFEEVLKMSVMVDESQAAEITQQINTVFAGRLSAVTSGYGAIDINLREGLPTRLGAKSAHGSQSLCKK